MLRRAAFKGALIVINLAFLTTQVSYKFYVCSSFPVFPSVRIAASVAPDYHRHTVVQGLRDGKPMSMDKRYSSELTFALLPPVTTITSSALANTPPISGYQVHLFIPAVLIPLQRGPPTV
jgi:hypothetical protein